jgi:hypothetical protein
MYFSGHDHILQHTIRGGVSYFGSGAGAQKHTGVDRRARPPPLVPFSLW